MSDRCLFVDGGRQRCAISRDRDDADDEVDVDDVESPAREQGRPDLGANRPIEPSATLFSCSCPRYQEHLFLDDTPGKMPSIGF